MQSYEAFITVSREDVARLSLFSFIIQSSAIKQHKNTLFRIIKETKPNLVQLLGGFSLNRSLCVNFLVSLSWFS